VFYRIIVDLIPHKTTSFFVKMQKFPKISYP